MNKAGTRIIINQSPVKKGENCKGTEFAWLTLLEVTQGALRQDHNRELPMFLLRNINLLAY